MLHSLKKGKSLINPSHFVIVYAAIQKLRAAGAEDSQITVLTPYEGQLRLLRTWQTADLTVATVDSAQGKAYDFVILDTVIPGGMGSSLGFMMDLKRMCVGLSRARIGLLVVGNSTWLGCHFRRLHGSG